MMKKNTAKNMNPIYSLRRLAIILLCMIVIVLFVSPIQVATAEQLTNNDSSTVAASPIAKTLGIMNFYTTFVIIFLIIVLIYTLRQRNQYKTELNEQKGVNKDNFWVMDWYNHTVNKIEKSNYCLNWDELKNNNLESLNFCSNEFNLKNPQLSKQDNNSLIITDKDTETEISLNLISDTKIDLKINGLLKYEFILTKQEHEKNENKSRLNFLNKGNKTKTQKPEAKWFCTIKNYGQFEKSIIKKCQYYSGNENEALTPENKTGNQIANEDSSIIEEVKLKNYSDIESLFNSKIEELKKNYKSNVYDNNDLNKIKEILDLLDIKNYETLTVSSSLDYINDKIKKYNSYIKQTNDKIKTFCITQKLSTINKNPLDVLMDSIEIQSTLIETINVLCKKVTNKTYINKSDYEKIIKANIIPIIDSHSCDADDGIKLRSLTEKYHELIYEIEKEEITGNDSEPKNRIRNDLIKYLKYWNDPEMCKYYMENIYNNIKTLIDEKIDLDQKYNKWNEIISNIEENSSKNLDDDFNEIKGKITKLKENEQFKDLPYLKFITDNIEKTNKDIPVLNELDILNISYYYSELSNTLDYLIEKTPEYNSNEIANEIGEQIDKNKKTLARLENEYINNPQFNDVDATLPVYFIKHCLKNLIKWAEQLPIFVFHVNIRCLHKKGYNN